MPSFAQYVLRPVQFVFVLISLALSCTLPTQQVFGGSPTRVNYAIFASVFGMLTLIGYLIPSLFMHRFHHPLLHLLLDIFNTIFFLAAGIALAAQLGVRSCGDYGYLQSNGITNGGGFIGKGRMERRCREAQALTAFLWFAFAAFAVNLIFDIYEYVKRRDEVSGKRYGRSGRVMAQV